MINKIAKKLGFSEEGIKKYTVNTIWLFAERFLSLAISFFVGVAVIRYLGAHDYGIYSYAASIFLIISTISQLNFNDIITRESINNPNKAHEIFGTTVVMRSFTSAISFIIAMTFIYLTNDTSNLLSIFFIVASVIYTPFSTIITYFNSIVKSKYVSTAVLVAHIATSIAKIMLIILNAPLVAFALVAFLNSIILSFTLVYFLKTKGNSNKRWTFKFETMTHMLRSYWALIVIVIFTSLTSKIDVLFLKSLANITDVGIYGSAIRLVEILYSLPMLMLTSLFPAIVSSKQYSEQEYNNRVTKLLKLLTFSSIFASLCIMIFSDLIINILYSTEFAEAATILSISIWCLLFYSLNQLSLKWLITENLVSLMLVRIIIFTVLTVSLNYYFIGKYGIIGASVAMLISSIINGYLIDVISAKTRNLFILKTKAIIYPITYIMSLAKKRV